MPVLMTLARIVLNDLATRRNLIFLKEVEGDRQFAIEIGMCEARSIDQRVKKLHKTLVPPRPLTHDLVVNSIVELGGELDSIHITELRDATYYARLRVRHGSQMIDIDARPSDAVAIAVTCSPPLPIYVAEEVVDEASQI